ncbi:unnamed protein product [Linum trigynum]|uniref:BAH domain-containing protein n=1 Tax=Linum trigynum TaxID=586398 RepID=A0AAV2EFK0_9ROSI
MSGKDSFFVEWKEQFVSQERGNRVVHYFLKDSAGESILAIVGTERSVRHMFYVVAEEFVQAYGAENAIHTGFKWRSRREVVDWLTSMLSKQNVQGDHSNLKKCDLGQALESQDFPVTSSGGQHTQGRHLRIVNGHRSEIVWSGVAWTCGKQLKHFPAFCRNGTTMAAQSFVFVMAEGENHYVAYLEDMYEDRRGQKKVRVRWFHRNQEIKGMVPLRSAHPKEIFMTPYSQVISAECVDGPATVLTREHYEECVASIPSSFSARIHLCFRQLRSNKVKPFDLSKLRGYFDQPVLSCLSSKRFLEADDTGHGTNDEEDEEFSAGENVKLGVKRARIIEGRRNIEKDGSQMAGFQAFYSALKPGISGKRLLPLNNVELNPWSTPLLNVNEKIEHLCQDSGIRGCWFRCTVLQVSRRQIKVRYDDLRDEEECGNLEEWIPVFRLAGADKLGMRRLGRLTIRPAPSDKETNLTLEVGSAVDAWWSDGWWEGVVTSVNNTSNDVQVYFPGEKFVLNMQRNYIRTSQDWVDDQWIDIQPKPDILSAISATIKLPICSTTAMGNRCNNTPAPCAENDQTDNIEDEKTAETTLISSDGVEEDMDSDNLSQPTSTDEPMECGDGRQSIPSDKGRADCVDDISANNNNKEEDENPSNDSVAPVDGVADMEVTNEVVEKKVGADDNSSEKLEMEVFPSSGNNCKSIELMEVSS